MTRFVHTILSSSVLTRLLLGFVLLLAAGLKSFELIAESSGTVRWLSLAAQFTLLLGEVLLAGWLLSGWRWNAARRVTLIWLVVLISVSMHKWLTGEASCGCFGKLVVKPWITVLLDVAAFVAVLLSSSASDGFRSPLRRAGLVASQLLLLVALLMVLTSPIRQPVPLPEGLTQLYPHEWVGRQWVLADYIDVWPEISHGRWAVLLYGSNCHTCTNIVEEYEGLAHDWAAKKATSSVAMIDVSRTTSDAKPPVGSAALHGNLGGPAGWFVATPALVVLIDGRVVATGDGEDECRWNDRQFPQ